MTRSLLTAGVVSIALLVGAPAPVGAATLEAVRTEASSLASEIAAARRNKRFDAAAQRAAAERLGRIALEFVDLADKAALRGRQQAEQRELRAAYDAVAGPLSSIYESNAGELDRMARAVMDEDGDLEALYETESFRGAQLAATHALYYLNWLHFYGARLHDGAERKALLEKAERGFSEFAIGDQNPQLQIESLLGRGLCHAELGKAEWAVQDLQAVIASEAASPERRAKAKIGLLDAYVRAGNYAGALRSSEKFLSEGALSRDEEAYVRFVRSDALLRTAKAGGVGADEKRREAVRLIDRLRSEGGAWKQRAEALLVENVDDPSKWAGEARSTFAKWSVAKRLLQEKKYEPAVPVLRQILDSTDAEAERYRAEAAYLLGLAEFQTGDFGAATEALQQAVSAGEGDFRVEALYLRFKALEAQVAGGDGAALVPAFRQAATEYVTAFPEHRSSYEAYLRLGELLQADGDFAGAMRMYEKVRGDPAFELRARFATVQCYFELLAGANGTPPAPAQRGEYIAQVGKLLPAIEADAARLGDDGDVATLRAKEAVLRAAYFSLTGAGDEKILAALREYEGRFPQQTELFATVLRQRLDALESLGRYAEAEAEVKAHGAVFRDPEQYPVAEALAKRFRNAAARAEREQGSDAAQAARRVSLALYELTFDGSGGAASMVALASLYEQAGEVQQARQLYEKVLASDAGSLAALKGLAQLAEGEERRPESLEYWRRFLGATRPGDHPWYLGQYEVARLTHATGASKSSCELLNELRPALPGLADPDLREKLSDLRQQACR